MKKLKKTKNVRSPIGCISCGDEPFPSLDISIPGFKLFRVSCACGRSSQKCNTKTRAIRDWNDMNTTLQTLSDKTLKLCKKFKWSRDWHAAGCYLHLEVSEFIESLRGKKGKPDLEAADVLFVLLSTLAHNKITIQQVLEKLKFKIASLE